ncbi:MAG: helix-turn-helix domain-containing protein [Actinomycetota bacterium]
MTGGRLIREARLRAGLTQAELAALLQTSQSVVARWESGTRKPSYDHVLRAVRTCGLELIPHLVPREEHDLGLALERLRLSPSERLDSLLHLLRVERELGEAKTVVDGDG